MGKEGHLEASAEHSWIDVKKFAEKAATAVAEQEERSSAATVIKFDEQSGEQLNEQLQFPEVTKEPKETIALLWREWINHNASLGAMEADIAAAVAVLHSLHECFDVGSQKTVVFYEEKHQTVVTTSTVPPGGIWLPPCVPNHSKASGRNNRAPSRSEAEIKSGARSRRGTTL